jgi:Spy/CpxP family protein refolding chaperone
MKTQTWIVILSLLVFGVGYTLGIITVRIVSGSTEGPRIDRRDSHGPRPDRGKRRGDRNGAMGPYLGSVQKFADELGLSDEQREKLRDLIEQTTEEVTRHERSISDLVLETRAKVDELLTDEQRDRLEELIQDSMRRYTEERIEGMVEWFRTEIGLEEDDLARVRGILEGYYEETGRYFREHRRENRWPDHKEIEASLAEMREARDAELKSYVSDRDLDRFRSVWGSRRRGR